MSGERILETVDPADAFAALSDPTRVEILRALWESDDDAVSFSELRAAVGARDSGGFNYHLRQLTDRFVATDDEGYRLTTAGRHVVGGLLAGAYTMEGRLDPIPLEEPCPFCGDDRTFRYEAERVTITCDGCPATMEFDVPPGAFAGREAADIPTVADSFLRTCQAQARAGICPACSGPIEAEVVPTVRELTGADPLGDGEDLPSDLEDVPLGRYECTRCGQEIVTDVGMDLVEHPAVVAFFHDHGIDVRAEPLTRFVAGGRNHAVVRERDPLRVAVTFEADGETIELLVDDALEVIDAERTDS